MKRPPVARYPGVVRYLFAALAVAPFLLVLAGMVTGRVRAKTCCSMAEEGDSRLRGAGSDRSV